MNYGTNGVISEYSGLLSGLNSFNDAKLTSINPPKKIFLSSRNASLAYYAGYSVYADRFLVIQYFNNQSSDIYVINPNNNTIENILTSPTDDRGGVHIECVGNRAYIYYLQTPFFKVLNLDTFVFTSDRVATGGTLSYSGVYSLLTDNLYLANYGSNTVSVINKTSLTLSSTISSTNGAVWALPVDSLNRLYISCYVSNSLQIFNLTTLSLITTITGIASCYSTAYCPTNNHLYVAAYSGNSVVVVNCSNNTITTSISIPSSTPLDVKYNPNNGLIYVTLSDSTFRGVAIINPSTNTVIEYYREVTRPFFLTFCPTNNKMYFTQYDSNNLTQL